MEYFTGLDVSLRSCALCILDARGGVVFERELSCDVDEIVRCLDSFAPPITRIGFEAGTMSQHLFCGLTSCGFDVVCMEARQVSAALSAMRNKTDKNDACSDVPRDINQTTKRSVTQISDKRPDLKRTTSLTDKPNWRSSR